MTTPRILPRDLIEEVEQYVESELRDQRQYSNRELFDGTGIWSLHKLAAAIYAAGWRDGEQAEASRQRGERRREREALRAEVEAAVGP